MKTFLNVLYRRILYRIPLKFLLVLLAVWAVFIACFSSADFLYNSATSSSMSVKNVYQQVSSDNNSHIFCNYRWSVSYHTFFSRDWVNDDKEISTNYIIYCWTWTMYIKLSSQVSQTIYITESITDLPSWNCPTCPTCPSQYTSLECQSEYDLIPISSVDSNYCTTNNLCPACETCPTCPVWTGGVSSFYINNILHVGSPIVNMTIPSEIDWDYEYVQWWTVMNIDIEWYNVDEDYIEWIITVQNYKPDSYDFTNLVSNVIPLFVPWLCIILLLYFIFRFIKKIF